MALSLFSEGINALHNRHIDQENFLTKILLVLLTQNISKEKIIFYYRNNTCGNINT
jgi:hypothetical protein